MVVVVVARKKLHRWELQPESKCRIIFLYDLCFMNVVSLSSFGNKEVEQRSRMIRFFFLLFIFL